MQTLPKRFGTHLINAAFFLVFAGLSAYAQQTHQSSDKAPSAPPTPAALQPPVAATPPPSAVQQILQHTGSAPLPSPTAAAPASPTPAPAAVVQPSSTASTPATATAPQPTAPAPTAPPQTSQPFTASSAYRECAKRATTDPQAALAKAEGWLAFDDSVGAHHCRAMALYGLNRFDEAGDTLAVVRSKIPEPEITLRTYVARQGSRAWIEAGKPQQAIDVLTSQINELTLGKGNNIEQAKLATELLLDRSKIRTEYGQLAQAVQDLDQAISLSPGNETVLLQRAKIFSQLGDNALAQQDLQVILRMNPNQREATALMRVLRDQQIAK